LNKANSNPPDTDTKQGKMNYPAAPISGIAASLGQATVYQAENYHRPKERGINPSPAAGGLNTKNQN